MKIIRLIALLGFASMAISVAPGRYCSQIRAPHLFRESPVTIAIDVTDSTVDIHVAEPGEDIADEIRGSGPIGYSHAFGCVSLYRNDAELLELLRDLMGQYFEKSLTYLAGFWFDESKNTLTWPPLPDCHTMHESGERYDDSLKEVVFTRGACVGPNFGGRYSGPLECDSGKAAIVFAVDRLTSTGSLRGSLNGHEERESPFTFTALNRNEFVITGGQIDGIMAVTYNGDTDSFVLTTTDARVVMLTKTPFDILGGNYVSLNGASSVEIDLGSQQVTIATPWLTTTVATTGVDGPSGRVLVPSMPDLQIAYLSQDDALSLVYQSHGAVFFSQHEYAHVTKGH